MQSDGVFFKPENGARWAVTRKVNGKSIYLIQDTPVANPREPKLVLGALDIPVTPGTIDFYFPRNGSKCRCPTFELIELWYHKGQR